ncbi:MAG TPA: hypothetical protein VFJ43_10125 [Bacteroidia bacterium]|nr:hypothetical protein [Bacteroidia bacterium]
MAFGYSACHESIAQVKSESGITLLKEQVRKFEQTLSDLKTIHADHVKQYSTEMGCTRDSKALEIINHHNELLDRHLQRLKYHKMKLAQADTSNADRNNEQLLELKKDFEQLTIDGNEIRTGFDNIEPSHVTK